MYYTYIFKGTGIKIEGRVECKDVKELYICKRTLSIVYNRKERLKSYKSETIQLSRTSGYVIQYEGLHIIETISIFYFKFHPDYFLTNLV